MTTKKNNQISVKSLAEMYGYHEVTMHRYLQRAEFSKFLYKHDGRQFRVIFTLDFKNRLEKFLSKLRGRAKWQKNKEK